MHTLSRAAPAGTRSLRPACCSAGAVGPMEVSTVTAGTWALLRAPKVSRLLLESSGTRSSEDSSVPPEVRWTQPQDGTSSVQEGGRPTDGVRVLESLVGCGRFPWAHPGLGPDPGLLCLVEACLSVCSAHLQTPLSNPRHF